MMESDWDQCTGINRNKDTTGNSAHASVCQCLSVHLPQCISHDYQSSAYITHSAKCGLDSSKGTSQEALYHCRTLVLLCNINTHIIFLLVNLPFLVFPLLYYSIPYFSSRCSSYISCYLSIVYRYCFYSMSDVFKKTEKEQVIAKNIFHFISRLIRP